MLLVATDVAWSVCLPVGHIGEHCKTGLTEKVTPWSEVKGGPRNNILDGNPDPPVQEAVLGGSVAF